MNRGFKISAVVAVGVASLLVAAILLYQPPNVYAQAAPGAGLGCQWSSCLGVNAMHGGMGPQSMHHRGWGRGPPPNFTVSTEEVQLSGRLVELDRGYLVIETGADRVLVKTPMWLLVDNKSVSTIRLAFEDKLNSGDQVQLIVYRVTMTRQDGSQRSFYLLKELIDQTTGLHAYAARPHLRGGGPAPETSYTGNA
jgi:hypothetical protein